MDPILPLKEFLTDLVVPDKRCNINIIPDHITMLQGTKSKKQVTKKRRKIKSTTLSRKEYARLGLYTLPTRQMKYADTLHLHQLWMGYAQEHLDLKDDTKIPEVYDPHYDAFSKLLVKMDLHGAIIHVIESKCATLVGLGGIVVLDSKNVLKVLGKDDRIRTIPKSECNFSIGLGNFDIIIFGKHLTVRPAERSVKKVKSFIEPLDL